MSGPHGTIAASFSSPSARLRSLPPARRSSWVVSQKAVGAAEGIQSGRRLAAAAALLQCKARPRTLPAAVPLAAVIGQAPPVEYDRKKPGHPRNLGADSKFLSEVGYVSVDLARHSLAGTQMRRGNRPILNEPQRWRCRRSKVRPCPRAIRQQQR